jgi:hypothetical protein
MVVEGELAEVDAFGEPPPPQADKPRDVSPTTTTAREMNALLRIASPSFLRKTSVGAREPVGSPFRYARGLLVGV